MFTGHANFESADTVFYLNGQHVFPAIPENRTIFLTPGTYTIRSDQFNQYRTCSKEEYADILGRDLIIHLIPNPGDGNANPTQAPILQSFPITSLQNE